MMHTPPSKNYNKDGNTKWNNINQRRKSKNKHTSSVDFVHCRAGSLGPSTAIPARASTLRRSPISPLYPSLHDDLQLSPPPPLQQTSNGDIANILRTIQLQLSEQSRKITVQDELIASLSASKTAHTQKAKDKRSPGSCDRGASKRG